MKSHIFRSLVFSLSTFALSVHAGAQTTVATFHGTLTSITETVPFWSGLSASDEAGVDIGTPFTLTVTYDPLTADFVYLGADLAIWQ